MHAGLRRGGGCRCLALLIDDVELRMSFHPSRASATASYCSIRSPRFRGATRPGRPTVDRLRRLRLPTANGTASRTPKPSRRLADRGNELPPAAPRRAHFLRESASAVHNLVLDLVLTSADLSASGGRKRGRNPAAVLKWTLRNRASKPVRSCSPRLGRFDSCAAPCRLSSSLGDERIARSDSTRGEAPWNMARKAISCWARGC
jgi:hypothetical protein